MLHNHESVAVNQLRKYVVLTNKDEEYIIEASDDEEAAYRAVSLASFMDEELKDVTPCSANDTRETWRQKDYG